MKNQNASRRRFLQLSYTVGAGIALPGWLAACGGDGGSEPDPGPGPGPAPVVETFLEPDRLMPKNGLLDVELRFAFADNMLDGQPVHLRSINGGLTGPTMDLHVGDTLRVLVHNDMPPNPPSVEPNWTYRYPNSTNFHTHGLHVDPGLLRPGVYSDYVVDDPREGVVPGSNRLHEFPIVDNHPPGTYWYHPHLHGATAIQVGSGMAGALIIRGPTDDVPAIKAAKERLFVFQAPLIDDNGELADFAVAMTTANETPFVVNGVRRPRLVMRPGEVQRFRFINAAVTNYLNLALDGHNLMRIGHDGNPRVHPEIIPASAAEGVVMAPGNRDDILVKAGAPGTYYLRTLAYNMGFPLAEDILAEVVVTGEPMDMALPEGPLPVPDILTPISDQELASKGGYKREIVLRTVGNNNGTPITAMPAAALLPVPPGELPIWTYQTGNTFAANTVYAIGSATGSASTDPRMPAVYYPFQSSQSIKQTIALDSVEEWTLYNMTGIQHPLHIHINPFQVIKINGEPVEPFWADTIALPRGGTPQRPTSITFRTRFLDFTGPYVMHCHLLLHEDLGMMQLVEVV